MSKVRFPADSSFKSKCDKMFVREQKLIQDVPFRKAWFKRN